MKKLKHIRLFESFLNEELSPETLKSFSDKAREEASKGDLDSNRRRNQANSASAHVSPVVQKAIKETEDVLKETYAKINKNKISFILPESEKAKFKVQLNDLAGLAGGSQGYANINIYFIEDKGDKISYSASLQSFEVKKESYTILRKNSLDLENVNVYSKLESKSRMFDLWTALAGDRRTIDKIKELISLVQEYEIAGEKK